MSSEHGKALYLKTKKEEIPSRDALTRADSRDDVRRLGSETGRNIAVSDHAWGAWGEWPQ